jgi:glycosyltransferase involved in cell wall biosynthesis
VKIHYISDHSILEYDEVQLLLDLGHEVFSNGAYLDPAGHITLPRPALKGGQFYQEYADLARTSARTDLPTGLIDPFDVIIVMHSPNVIIQNWEKLKHKTVIWRSIGQSVPHLERALAPMKAEGLIVVRYSPKERHLADYMGEDALIRFYKDENVYGGWTGEKGGVVSFTQSLKGRRDFCHYDEIMPVIEKFDGTVYGPGNEDLGKYNGGQVPFEQQLEIMRSAGVMVYGGTWPAPYTLSFIEALMMGLPIVAISKALAHIRKFEGIDFYEVDELLAECSGIVCNTVEQMIVETDRLLHNPVHANVISARQRELAMRHFSKAAISKQWADLLEAL